IAAGTGWSAYEELDNWKSEVCGEVASDITLPNAQYMLKLATDAHSKGEVSDAVNVEPVYLRDKVTWKKLPGRE
ncbi:MAG TPA: tRNA (adenosine(37)-N6)-threonylcarbamoyltransferase complex dimerization subunit type 1 TsaB, partial [Alteromonas macleodii]|nr:tRNA (adenosine(37)-N6)-threonylcarbamoyltransferase complex dimerization subunit type 1 TsaB [Alteromonas macleodii]